MQHEFKGQIISVETLRKNCSEWRNEVVSIMKKTCKYVAFTQHCIARLRLSNLSLAQSIYGSLLILNIVVIKTFDQKCNIVIDKDKYMMHCFKSESNDRFIIAIIFPNWR